MKTTGLAPILILGLATASGCATNVSESVTNALSSAPEWFDDRKTEVKGEGYPEFTDVPSVPEVRASAKSTNREIEKLMSEAEDLMSDPKAVSPHGEERRDPSIWAASVRAELEAAAQEITATGSDAENAADLTN